MVRDPLSAWCHQRRDDRRRAVALSRERDREAQGFRGAWRRAARRPAAPRFTIGEKVKIRYGALEGREALYAGDADKRPKAQVLVCLLGRHVMVKVAADAIVAR